MAWWSLFRRELDVEDLKRQLAPCVSTIIQHSAVAEYFVDFSGRIDGFPSIERAQQLLNFIGNRISDEEFMGRMRLALDRGELKGILRNASTTPYSSVNQGRPTNQRFVNTDEQERQRRERREIADWLSPLNFKASQIDHLQKREPGTGQWFLESQEFRDWRDGSSGTLWCPGSPGAGKTVLAAIVIDHLETIFKDDDASITWIYCNYKEKAEQTICNLIGSLLKQMVQNRPSPPKNIKALYDRHQNWDTRPPRDELERVTALEFTTYSKAFMIIDAVDEFPEDTGTQTELLQVLQTLSGSVKVLVTSRDVPTIKQWFKDERKIRIEAKEEDVRRYIQSRIDGTRLQHLKSLEGDIVNQVAERAEGMFLLVRLLMDLIVTKVSRASVREALKDMPKGMDAIYANALKRIREQDEDRRQLGEQVLKWITFAFRPLYLEELQEALAVVQESTSLNPEAIIDEEILMSSCAGLVSVDKRQWEAWGMRRCVRLIHYTAQSYFECTKIVHFPDAHIDIAKTCITYLSQDRFLGVQVPTYGAKGDLMKHHCLLEYAVHSWGDHVREQTDEDCDEMVLQFLEDEKKFLLSGQLLGHYINREVVTLMGIHLSSFFGLEHILNQQLLNGADPHQTDSGGRTSLSLAAARGHEKVVKMLLAQPNVDVDVIDKACQTPLLKAAENGHATVVELLLIQQNVDINFMDEDCQTPLIAAVKKGHVKVVELLLKQQDIDINPTDKFGMTPMLIASMNGHVKVLELLLKHSDVDANLTDDYGRTHLMVAARKGREQAVEVLMAETNVNINLADENGETLLSHAAVGGNENVVELLLAQPHVDINSTDKNGLTPLFRAAQYGHVKVVELLLKQPNIAMNLTNYPWAAKMRLPKVVKLLLDQLNLEVHSEHGLTLLYMAAEKGHRNLVEFLLTHPNIAMDNSQTLISSTSSNVHHKKLDVRLAHTLEHESKVQHICFSMDGNYLATACNHTVFIHDTKTGEKICNLVDENMVKPGADLYIKSLCFSADGKYLATGAEDMLIRIWDIANKSIWRIFEGHESDVVSVDFSRDGRFIVSCSERGAAFIWDMETCEPKTLLIADQEDHVGGAWSVVISPDGQLIAAGSDVFIRLWDTQSGALIERLDDGQWASWVAFTPDGKGLVSAGSFWDYRVRYWDLSPFLRSPSRSVPLTEPYDLESELPKTWSEKGSVRMTTFKGHNEFVSSVAVSQDGQWVASGSWDRSVRFWDLRTGQSELVLWGHEEKVLSVDLSPTGGMLATRSSDGCAKLWSYTWGKRKGVMDINGRRLKARVD